MFGRLTLKPVWSFTAEGVLWRVLFGARGRIAGESRNTEKKTTSFFCLDGSSGTLLWQNLKLEEPWWVGMEAIHNDVVILHGFEKPDLPEHKRIYVLEAATGKELWRNLRLTFWFAYKDRLFAYEERFDRRVGHVLSLTNGEILETHEEGIESFAPVRQLSREENVQEQLLFPEPFDIGGLQSDVKEMIARETKRKIMSSPLEGIVREGYLLLGYYCPARDSTPVVPRLESHFVIVDRRRGKPVFSEVLQANASAPVPDSFFIKESTVYYVKDQRTLSAIALPENKES